MDQVTEATAEFERDLDGIPFLKTAQDVTRIPKTAILVFVLLTSFIVLYVTIGPGLLCNLVGFVYPAYASFKAIESEGKEDDTQWLTYWVVYAIFNIVETFADVILFWFPFYYSLKFGFLIWLFLPSIRGAQYLYNTIILPFFTVQEKRFNDAVQDIIASDEEENLDDDGEDDGSDEDKKDK
mmetsp:Transcript_9701/g.31082  ORF Transcript_9701/g.31082 Transcript_9701/m.31082 type:complete len:182 (+) Transcript_9701:199-744(+)